MALGLPFGWAPAPGVFTKFLKETITALRTPYLIKGNDWEIKNSFLSFGDYLVTAFLDDMLAIATSYTCTKLLSIAMVDTLRKLGLFFHVHKCVLEPTEIIEHLGFKLIINK